MPDWTLILDSEKSQITFNYFLESHLFQQYPCMVTAVWLRFGEDRSYCKLIMIKVQLGLAPFVTTDLIDFSAQTLVKKYFYFPPVIQQQFELSDIFVVRPSLLGWNQRLSPVFCPAFQQQHNKHGPAILFLISSFVNSKVNIFIVQRLSPVSLLQCVQVDV